MIVGDREQIENQLVDTLAAHINDFIKNQGKVLVGVVGGRGVSAIFRALKKKKIEWDKVHIGLLDERFVDRGDAESNFKLLEDVMADLSEIHLYPVVADVALSLIHI